MFKKQIKIKKFQRDGNFGAKERKKFITTSWGEKKKKKFFKDGELHTIIKKKHNTL